MSPMIPSPNRKDLWVREAESAQGSVMKRGRENGPDMCETPKYKIKMAANKLAG